MKPSRPFLILCFGVAGVVLAVSAFAKSKGWNQAFNRCTTKMQDAYAECLNKPYNSVAMCQNVANGVYNRCMRSAGYYPRDNEVPNPIVKPTCANEGAIKTSPTPKPTFSPKIRPLTDATSTTTMEKKTASPTPRPSTSPRRHKG